MELFARDKRVDFAVYSIFSLLGLVLFLAFNSKGVQCDDAWIAYLPGAVAIERLDLALLREAMNFGLVARPFLPSFAAAIARALFRFLTHPQALHLVTVLATVATLILAYRTAHRWIGAAAIGAPLLLLTSAAFLPYALFTTPDMLFTMLLLATVLAAIDQRPVAAATAFALALLTRSNGFVLAPALLAWLWAMKSGPKRPRIYAAAVVAGAVAFNSIYGRWVAPGRSAFNASATEWAADVFIANAEGWSFEAKMRWRDVEQYFLLAKRILWSAPRDLIANAAADRGFHSLIAAGVWLTGVIALVVRSLQAAVRDRNWSSPGVLALVALLSFHAPLALYHWETRYWLPLYAAGIIAGWVAVVSLARTRGVAAATAAAAIVLSAAAFEGYAAARHLAQSFPLRERLSLDDSNHRYPPAEDEAHRVLSLMIERAVRRPIGMINCEALPMQRMNFVRYQHYAKDFKCLGKMFGVKATYEQVDFGALYEHPRPTTEPYMTLFDHGERVTKLGDGFVLVARPAEND
jgi:hypothetical protein